MITGRIDVVVPEGMIDAETIEQIGQSVEVHESIRATNLLRSLPGYVHGSAKAALLGGSSVKTIAAQSLFGVGLVGSIVSHTKEPSEQELFEASLRRCLDALTHDFLGPEFLP